MSIDFSNAAGLKNEDAFGFPTLPKGAYRVTVKSAERKETTGGKAPGSLMPTIALKVEEGEFTNQVVFFRPVLGKEGDLGGEDPKTQESRAWKQFKLLVVKSGYRPRSGERIEQVLSGIVGNSLVITVEVRNRAEVKNPDGTTKYEAKEENNITGFYSVGESLPAQGNSKAPSASVRPSLAGQPVGGGLRVSTEGN